MALTACEGLEVSLKKGLHIIRFNRPNKRNAFSAQMYGHLTSLLNAAATDERIVVTALTGTGEFYSSGNDISASAEVIGSSNDISAAAQESTAKVRKFVSAFIDYPKMLVAVVNGPAIGIAATTLGLCDIVYASDKAYILTPFTKLGLVPEGCSSYLFPRIMGNSKASDVLFMGEKISAYDAEKYGLVSKVFSSATFQEVVWPRLEELAQMPRQSLMASKRLVRGCIREELHKANEKECKELEGRFGSEESFNAVIAFMSRKSKM
ncbi:Enoyl-CoA delta isomerase 2 [Blattella germanica]|nr:Enoyl-CoA delta isomerase 2 [Blattella germanica]